MRNKMRYYAHVYRPKSDWRVVVVSAALGLSLVQYGLQHLMNARAVQDFKKNNDKFLKEVKRVAKLRLEESRLYVHKWASFRARVAVVFSPVLS